LSTRASISAPMPVHLSLTTASKRSRRLARAAWLCSPGSGCKRLPSSDMIFAKSSRPFSIVMGFPTFRHIRANGIVFGNDFGRYEYNQLGFALVEVVAAKERAENRNVTKGRHLRS